MKIFAVRALAKGVLLESIRRKDLWVVAILGGVILFGAGALGFFGIDGLEVFVKDLAATVLGAFATVVAVLTSTRMMPEEIRQRTLYPLLARPITRWDLLLGKFLGCVLVSWVAFAILSLVTAFALLTFQIPFEPIMLQYILAKLMGLVVVCSIGLALSTVMTPAAAATLSFLLAFGGSMIVRGMLMAYETADPATRVLFQVVNAMIPQVSLFDLSGRAIYFQWSPVPAWVMGWLAAYMVAYSATLVALAWLRFRRQAL